MLIVMKRFIVMAGVAVLMGLMSADSYGQRGRENYRRPQSTERKQAPSQNRPSGVSNHRGSRPGNMGMGNNQQGYRPQGRPGNRPQGRPESGSQVRPDNRPQGGFGRPGNGRPEGNGHHHGRPGDYRPHDHHGYHHDHHHGHGPQFGHRPPFRPYMPANRRWYRPTPPPSFRVYPGAPRFSTILGIALGSAVNYTVNALLNAGYNVAGYGTNAVYLTGVPMMNMSWPNVTMNYIDGRLRGSEFTYSSPGYDMSRYNMLYADLTRQYGYPTSVQDMGGGNVSATWWGYDNGFITLSYFADYAYNGARRYYTTLSIGN